ncbi:MAG: iron-sulfur cluster insertion protein ErpA [Candidatus Marinimicrobia bacterium]|nr:iron-sulfur cluster insertion protein ErpA [Candidatus Neomarinimicrobiota bacterium]MCF7828400.1 iron-sulfur cluster insertion protein ErpA [Candidatus Neomarinimicrobiota bacterium]MCF7881006.1 iron-sulfur cluster insertion protein ErpA [Candidatus Neomarinimicrobiota bacterium]
MVTLSERAENKLRTLLQEQNKEEHGLRVYIQGGGCSGMSYGMEFEDEPEKSDEVLEQNGIKVIVDKFSLKYIDGSEIDYADEGLMGGSFQVVNPQAKSTCGCGQSFKA